MTNLIRKVQTMFADAARALAEGIGMNDRAVGVGSIYEQTYTLVDQKDPWAWIMDIFHNDDGSMFAVVASEGKLYRMDLSLSQGEVSGGDWVEVVQEFVPTGRSLKVVRQADGSWRGFLIASTTVLNRVGEIDSTELHDNLNRRSQESGDYPYIDFFHFGPDWRMGQVDFLARDENVALASFVFDDTPLGRAMVEAYNADPEYWGASISYHPIGEPERMQIGDVSIPVYRDGTYDAITLLPEKAAASLFTALRSTQEKNRMNKAVLEALAKLAGGNDDLLAQFVEQVDETNRQITERGLIRREGGETEGGATPAPAAAAAAEPPAAESTPAETDEEEEQEQEQPAMVLDDEAVDAIVAALVQSEGFTSAIAAALTPVMAQATETAEALRSLTASIQQRNTQTDARLASLEATDEEKQRTWVADASRKVVRQTQVTYRPRQGATVPNQTNPAQPFDSEDRANATLAKLGVL